MEGLVCGRYRIVKRLGAGGMAEVWLGQHEVIEQQAAIKVLQPHMSANKMVAKRFLKEAQATVAIKHPGIVAIHDVGFVTFKGKERAYIIMELLEGETLTERLDRQGPMSISQAQRVIKQLAGAMDAAHRKHIYHRDLKPDNMFLVRDPEVAGGERIKVLDFGLAKQAAEAGSIITSKGTVFGTPAYMAPEQCLDSGAIDGRADLYSIGCIFYRMLCGRTPFVSGEPLKLLKAQMFDQPPAPRSVRPDIPIDVESLILKLLEKKPEQRVQDCNGLLSLLGGLRESVTLVDDGPGEATLIELQRPVGEGAADGQTLVTLGNPVPDAIPARMPSDLDTTNRVAVPSRGVEHTLPLQPPPGYQRAPTHGPVASKRRKRSFVLLAFAILSAGVLTAGLLMFQGEVSSDGMVVVFEDAGAPVIDATRPVADASLPVVVSMDAGSTVIDAGPNGADAQPDANVVPVSKEVAKPVLGKADLNAKVADMREALSAQRYSDAYRLAREIMNSAGNRRHPEATRFGTMAACMLGKESSARRYFRRVTNRFQSLVDKFCKQKAGLELVPAADK